MAFRSLISALAFALVFALAPAQPGMAQEAKTGNVIFFHPDGAGLNHWGAIRMLKVGPDKNLHWDMLPAMAVYKGHLKDALTSTSHGGATVHAYGVKVAADSFGLDGTAKITAASGKQMSILEEALAAGKAVGLIQSGHIAEPGTAVFAASVEFRSNREEIAAKVIASGVQVIMAGGERYMLPKGTKGRHAKDGTRKDGRNLIEEAKKAGYVVVYTKEELDKLDLAKVDKLLGVFADKHSFFDKPEQVNQLKGRDHYLKSAPTIGEMGAAALKILSRAPKGFFLVAEEEGTDNMANNNNAPGEMEALRRADDAVKLFHDFIKAEQASGKQAKTMLIMAADSDAGGMQVLGPGPGRKKEGGVKQPRLGGWPVKQGKPLAPTDYNGAPLDGRFGTISEPFMSAPDKEGKRWPFAIAWATHFDASGGILVRGAGLNSELIRGTMDNSDIYKMMYLTLFGKKLP